MARTKWRSRILSPYDRRTTHAKEYSDFERVALDYHEFPFPGKLSVVPTKRLVNQRDLALAYLLVLRFRALRYMRTRKRLRNIPAERILSQ